MEANYDVKISVNAGGWKHGLCYAPLGDSKVIVLAKDPFAWLSSMYRYVKDRPDQSRHLLATSFSEFLRSRLVLEGSVLTEDQSLEFQLTSPTPPDHWNSFYFYWQSVTTKYDQCRFVRYEDLLDDAEKTCEAIAQWASLSPRQPFQNQSRECLPRHDGVAEKLGREFARKEYFLRREYLNEFGKEDIWFVRARLLKPTLDHFGY
jgi:hypothetical protein